MLNSVVILWRKLPTVSRAASLAFVVSLPLSLVLGRARSEIFRDWCAKCFSQWAEIATDSLWIFMSLWFGLMFLIWLWHELELWPKLFHVFASNSKYRIFDDAALEAGGNDELERTGFVQTLSKTVVLPPNSHSLVLALEASWGEGKSSVLSLLIRELEMHPDEPLVVRFNPWVATGRDRIFRAFFSQFSAALLGEGEVRLAKGIVKFGETLEELLPSSARALPRIGFQRFSRILGRIPVIDLEGEKDNLRDAVQATGKPLVVIIDDLDRLAPNDIGVVFQLVKAVADFPRVTYVLAFDPEPIDSALSFGPDVEKGRQFREKIVQANISLPRVPYSTRKRFLVNKLRSRVKAWKIQLSDRENELVDRAIPTVLAALRTPRDIKRTLNKTLIAAENIHGEVNFADILVFEALHAKYPKIANLIRERPRVVDPSGRGDEELTNFDYANIAREIRDDEPSKSERLKEFIDLYPEDRSRPSAIMQFLFPTLFSDSSESEYGDLSGDLRMAIHSNLLKYLYSGIYGELLSSRDAIEFFRKPESRAAILGDALDENMLPAWLDHIRHLIPSAAIANPLDLMHSIISSVRAFYRKTKVDASSESRWVLIDILKQLSNESMRQTLDKLFEDPSSTVVAEEILVPLLRDAGLWERGEYFGPGNLRVTHSRDFESLSVPYLESLTSRWLIGIRSLGIKKIILHEPNAVGALFRWGQLTEPPFDDVTNELLTAVSDAELAVAFFGRFPPGVSLEGVEKLITREVWTKLRPHIKVVPEAIRDRFLDHFEHLYQGPEQD